MQRLPLSAGVVAALVFLGCGQRADFWSRSPDTPVTAVASTSAIALVDAPAERVVLLSAGGDLSLTPTYVPIGRAPVATAATRDGKRILTLTRGDVPRRSASDQPPALWALTGLGLENRYELTDPLSGLDLDPEGRFAIVHATDADASFVENPNELVVVDLTAPPGATNPAPFTLRSFGGKPQRIDFTPTLGLPGGPRRLLVVSTDRDVGLIDLGDLTRADVTVRLTESATKLTPAGFAVTDGDPARDDDARIAIRVANDANVVVLDLLPPTDPSQGAFRPTPNVIAIDGVPSDIAFVRTDGGLRLAALVPDKQVLALVDPGTGAVTDVALGGPFSNIALVTDQVGAAADGSDVALLWSPSFAAIALVALGTTVGKPYKSVETIPLESPVALVADVPAPNARLKILTTTDRSSFFVLDLLARTASPLVASESGVSLTLAPDGGRAWALVPGSTKLASIDLGDLHPLNLLLARPIQGVLDVTRTDGGRALVAVHATGAVGLTVLDGHAPSLLSLREYAAVLEGGGP